MYLERMRRRDRYGHIYHHYCLTSRKGGKVIRKYISRAAFPFVRRMVDERKTAKRFVAALKPVFKSGSPGPVPSISELQRSMLKSAGYKLSGGMRIVRDRRKFFGRKQVEFRHSMLNAGALAIARTPQDLERIERTAISLQTSLSRAKFKGVSYETCLAAVFSAEASSLATGSGTSAVTSNTPSSDNSS